MSSYREFSGPAGVTQREEEDAFVVDAHRGTYKFIWREKTSSTIEKSPVCNGRFSLISSSDRLDETCSSDTRKNIRKFLRHYVYWRFLSNIRDFIVKRKERGRGLLHAIIDINSLFCTRISLDLQIHIFADR